MTTLTDEAMDLAQIHIVKGDSPETVAAILADAFPLTPDEALNLAAETARHPVTLALVRAKAKGLTARMVTNGWHRHSWATNADRTHRTCFVCGDAQAKRSGKWEALESCVEIATHGFDPYGTSCDLAKGHDGPHEGSDFFGDGRMRWTGGGSCAGDPLPFSILEHVEASA